jgi:hypothetical protein
MHINPFVCMALSTFYLTAQGQSSNEVRPEPGYHYYLVVNHADDKIIVSMNQAVIYGRETYGDPAFNDRIDITDKLQKTVNTGYVNRMVVSGWNNASEIQGPWPFTYNQINPWHFQYHVERVNDQTGQVEILVNVDVRDEGPKIKCPGYWVGPWVHEIVKY